jgi:acyl-CoA synthetase (AMP-forming)/AMP-acid ligase II
MRLEIVLAALAERQPERDAVICGTERLSYGALQDSVTRLAQGLANMGLGVGDRIVLYLPNGVEFVQAFYAALSLGAIAVPVTTRMTISELTFFCEDSAPAIVVCHAEQAVAVEATLAEADDIQSVIVGDATSRSRSFAALLSSESGTRRAGPIDQEDCLVSYTSGTTGRPKGAIATHANVLIQHAFIHAVEWGITAEDRFLVATPLAHRTGFGRLANALTLGGTIVVMEQFDPAEAVRLIERERITVMGMVPTVCRMMVPHIAQDPEKCRTLRRVVVTGEAFPVELKRQFIALLPDTKLVSFFAMTEAGAVTCLSHAEQFTHPASVGRPTPGVEVRIVDEAGRDAEPGAVGEVLVRSGRPGAYTVMKGYWNRPAETETAIRDGWLHTGDLGRLDGDGYLYIADRKKDMILSGGFNIYSKEIEQVLIACPGVADAAVVGVPDSLFGEAVAAYIEPEPGAAPATEDILAHCRQLLASYKKPKYVAFMATLPRNATGKVLKRDLAAKARADLPLE